MKPFLVEGGDPFTQHDQYLGCWCPGDVRSQDIGSHGVDLVLPDYSRFSTRWLSEKYTGVLCGYQAYITDVGTFHESLYE